MTGDSLGHFEQEENGSSDMKGKKAKGKEKGDGDDRFDGFAPPTGVRGVSTKENGGPLIPS